MLLMNQRRATNTVISRNAQLLKGIFAGILFANIGI